MADSYRARKTLKVGSRSYEMWSLAALPQKKVARLPYSLKILLENLLRFEDGVNVTRKDIDALLNWKAQSTPDHEISFTPARVIMQDFTGVPCVVDLAAMREAIRKLGGDPQKVNPLAPAELVIDHSVQVDHYGTADALAKNTKIEFQRNGERYSFLRWGQTAFRNFKVVPPNTGIVHQVNLEFLGRVVFENKDGKKLQAYPDTLVGTDSHTTMINGLGVLGWGVGGIEAEAVMLGQPTYMLLPEVVGMELTGQLPEGRRTTARSCVTIIAESPISRTKPRSRSSKRACTLTSSPPVGSSMNTRRGPVTRLRAICKRCCIPPEKALGRSSTRSAAISTRPNQSTAASRIWP